MNGANFQIPRPPFNRQNRRRQRPGARARKALSIRETHQHEYEEGLSVAADRSIWLPSEKYPPCSCFSCHYVRNEELVDSRLDVEQQEALESEQRRLFGGDVGDDALRKMGILYEDSEDSDATIKPTRRPEFYIRPSRPKRVRFQLQLPVYLAQSLLRDSPEIAPWFQVEQQLSRPSFPTRTTIQHLPSLHSRPPTPQSLPALSCSSSVSVSVSVPSPTGPVFSPSPSNFSYMASPVLFPLARDDEDLADETWDFITSSTLLAFSPSPPPPSSPLAATPSSEPETWVLLE